jgi:predicted RNA binding protein YcfA (HicA-like mRNA interferase family)
VKYRDFIRILADHGFVEVRCKGSHHTFEGWIGGRRQLVQVSYHLFSDDIAPGTLASMIRQSGLPKSLFR